MYNKGVYFFFKISPQPSFFCYLPPPSKKKLGAYDGDSAGTLAYKKDDSYAFSNAIR